MDLGIAGRKALIAGGSAGMGRGAALALAKEGVSVVIAARNPERLERAAREIGAATDSPVRFVACDHTTAAGRAALANACPEPDILVITASPARATWDFREIEADELLRSFESAAVGPIELMRTFIDGMCTRKFGRIVNIATVAAKHPAEFRLLSGPPRAAMLNYIGAVSRTVARHGVIMNTVLPGMYLTEAQMGVFAETAAKQGKSVDGVITDYIKRWRIPTRTLGNSEDVGALVAFLCGQQARYMVGQSLVVDGGMTSGIF